MSKLLPVIPESLTPECLAEHSSRGPRYTSYPPATELGPMAATTVQRELERAREDGPASIYVHIPFCRSLCWYCGCNVVPTRDVSRGEAYVDQVATEMALLVGALGSRFPVSEIALGGGSPNFLTPKAVRTLMASLECYFDIQPDARRSVELDPRATSASHVETFASAGFRSLSVGVQDFSAPVQDAIHRHQSAAQTAWLIEHARSVGFRDVNVDIVYGLPRQNEQSFAETLRAVIDLAPDRIALFGYAHLPAKLPHQALVERAGRVLDRYERATLLLLAMDILAAAGYEHIGLDHFAKPGSALANALKHHKMIRTFQGYVEHKADTILGLGSSSISMTKRLYWQNHVDLADWEKAIAAGKLPVAKGLALDADDQIRRVLINRLMCEGEVDLGALGEELGIDPSSYFARELGQIEQMTDLASYDPAKRAIKTTPTGRLLVRNVCMVFDRYFNPSPDEQRFSSTI